MFETVDKLDPHSAPTSTDSREGICRTQVARFHLVERIIRIYASYAAAEEAERVALSAMTPQQRLDQALALHAHYREAFGDAGQGLARVARTIPFKRR